MNTMYVFQFWTHSLLTKAASEHGAGEGHLSQGMCGALAGLCATLFSFPCDTIRTRLIAQGYPKVTKCWSDLGIKIGG